MALPTLSYEEYSTPIKLNEESVQTLAAAEDKYVARERPQTQEFLQFAASTPLTLSEDALDGLLSTPAPGGNVKLDSVVASVVTNGARLALSHDDGARTAPNISKSNDSNSQLFTTPPKRESRTPSKHGTRETNIWTNATPKEAPLMMLAAMACRQPFESAQEIEMRQKPLQPIPNDVEEDSATNNVSESTPTPPNTPTISVATTIQSLSHDLLAAIPPPAYSIPLTTGCAYAYEAPGIMQVPVVAKFLAPAPGLVAEASPFSFSCTSYSQSASTLLTLVSGGIAPVPPTSTTTELHQESGSILGCQIPHTAEPLQVSESIAGQPQLSTTMARQVPDTLYNGPAMAVEEIHPIDSLTIPEH